MHELCEAHRLRVEPHPVCEPTALDIAHHVVDRSQADRGSDRRRGELLGRVAGLQVTACEAPAVDERVDRLAVDTDLRELERAAGVARHPWLAYRTSTSRHGGPERDVDVVDHPGKVVDTIAVGA